MSDPELVCAFALGRGLYCRLPHRHRGAHRPDYRPSAPPELDATTAECLPAEKETR